MTATQTELQAIDVSAIVAADTDPAEVRELKAKVKAVADKYTNRHGWCDEVKRALAEIGIEEPKPVTILVTIASPPAEFPITVLPRDLHGKTAQQQAALLARKVGMITLTSPTGIRLSSKPVTPDLISGMTLVTNTDAVASLVDAWVFTAPQGRVRHYVRGINNPTRRNRLSTACGEYVYVDGPGVTPMREGITNPRRCKKCDKALA